MHAVWVFRKINKAMKCTHKHTYLMKSVISCCFIATAFFTVLSPTLLIKLSSVVCLAFKIFESVFEGTLFHCNIFRLQSAVHIL